MIKAEFGIIDDFDENNDYTGYDPNKYHCVSIDDDRYISAWWNALSKIDTLNVYEKGVLQPQKSLSRWGITIIPPSSLPAFLDIVISDKRAQEDKHLVALSSIIHQAISDNKFMIHYGV